MTAISPRFKVIVGSSFLIILLVYVVFHYKLQSQVQSQDSQLPTEVSLKELLSVSIELSQLGGEQVARFKKELLDLHAESKGKTKEGREEMKTNGDMTSHRVIISGFHQAFPELKDKLVSEEHDDDARADVDVPIPRKELPALESLADRSVPLSDVTIWIDPLDATQEYTEDLDQYVTVMICVAVKGVPTIGVIHRPIKSESHPKETVWAWVDHGTSEAFLKPVRTGDIPDEPKVIISRSHSGDAAAELNKAFSGKGLVAPAGGAGYKTLEVLRGKQDVYVHVTRIKKWDICAGNALINAAGGRMTTLQGETINYGRDLPVENDSGLLASVSHFDTYMSKLAPGFLAAHINEHKGQANV